MNKKTISIPLPQIEGVELKNATVDLEKGVVVAEYEKEDKQEYREKDISEIAVDFGSAVGYLFEDTYQPVFRTTKKHMTKLYAFNQLMILAEAWNSFDEFKPEWKALWQEKHYPEFELKNGKFEFSHASFARLMSNPYISSFSFKTPERAEQFATQFIDLFRIVLTN